MAKPHKGKKSSKAEPAVQSVISIKAAQPVAAPLAPSPSPQGRGEILSLSPPDKEERVGVTGATLQQRRAHFALTRIRPLADEWKEGTEKQKEFNRYASAMPFMIHANGLGQTAAFYRRKGTEHTYYQLYKLLGDWLSQPDQPFAGQPDLLEGITQSDMATYLAAQIEAMLFLNWVKKLASAFLAREEEASL